MDPVVVRRGRACFVASDGREYSLHDPQVKIVFPSMGRTLSEVAGAALRGLGIRAECVPLPDSRTLMAGRSHTFWKECLPLILTVGSLVQYLDSRRASDELTVYFMPSTNGNCRFSQYSVFINGLIQKNRLENVVTMTLTSENGYVMHGMADDNVLFTNSTSLFKALVARGIPFDAMPYPGSNHAALTFPDTGVHGWNTILRFFDRELKPETLVEDEVRHAPERADASRGLAGGQ